MMTVTVAKEDGTLVFVGRVPEDHVTVTRRPNGPSSCTVKMPMQDGLAYLELAIVNPPFKGPDPKPSEKKAKRR
jgi:hypothetical protein